MPEVKQWVITTDLDHSLAEIERNLRAEGFAVNQMLTEIGVVTGTAEDDVIERVRAIPGVTDVSPDTEINIGPPDSPITW